MVKTYLLSAPRAALFRAVATMLISALLLVTTAAASPGSGIAGSADAVVPAQLESRKGAALAGTENAAMPALSLETTPRGRMLVLDWTVVERIPGRFCIRHPDGRLIATRIGKRSVQGWVASIRVSGWPGGVYQVIAEAGGSRSSGEFILP